MCIQLSVSKILVSEASIARITCSFAGGRRSTSPTVLRRRRSERHGLNRWIKAAKKRLHRNVLAIALANKLARIALERPLLPRQRRKSGPLGTLRDDTRAERPSFWDEQPGYRTRRPFAMRMIFALMDRDGDGTISLEEFQAAHESIFKAMDADKDGTVSREEMLDFMRGTAKSPHEH